MYRSPENEATLPVIYSMFEFTKAEQEKLFNTRQQFNQEKIGQEVKDKSKKLFGKLFNKGGKSKTDGSLNSGNTGGNNSQGNK